MDPREFCMNKPYAICLEVQSGETVNASSQTESQLAQDCTSWLGLRPTPETRAMRLKIIASA